MRRRLCGVLTWELAECKVVGNCVAVPPRLVCQVVTDPRSWLSSDEARDSTLGTFSLEIRFPRLDHGILLCR